MTENVCCFTGHRRLPAHRTDYIRKEVEKNIQNLISSGVHTFICGGAVGFDMLCGICVLKLMEENPDISLIMAIPHKQQDKFFDYQAKHIYRHLINNSTKNVFISDKYDPGCLHRRNKYMVDNSNHVIAYCVLQKGGTFATVEYAKAKNKNIIFI